MNCPKCGKKQVKVIDSRTLEDNHVRRERACYKCGYCFITYEVTAVEYRNIKEQK